MPGLGFRVSLGPVLDSEVGCEVWEFRGWLVWGGLVQGLGVQGLTGAG